MINNFRKLIVLLVLTGLILNNFTYFSYALKDFSESEEPLVIQIGRASGFKNHIVEVPISFSNVPTCGLDHFEFKLKYELEDIEIIGIEPGDIVMNPEKDLGASLNYDESSILFVFTDESAVGKRNIKNDGVFATIIIRVKNESEKFSLIELLNQRPLFSNYDYTMMPFVFKSGGVNLNESGTDEVNKGEISAPVIDLFTVELEDISARKGETIEIPIYLKDLPDHGIDGLSFGLNYDPSKLDILSISDEGLVSIFYYYIFEGSIGFNFLSLNDKITKDGILAFVTVRVKEDASVGSTQIIGTRNSTVIYPSPKNNYNLNIGKIYINPILGDLNDDGVINSTDYILLRRYILGINNDIPLENKVDVADINGDGKIDSTDCVLLRKYILEITNL
ncbi:UNVERIFIED_CONTAM: dockerin type I repeat protein [Acetivibrio alkalicellulosi]